MSRGPDNIIAEYLEKQQGYSKDHSRWVAEEIEEALEAEGFMPVHRDCTLMFSADEFLQHEVNQRNRQKSGRIHG